MVKSLTASVVLKTCRLLMTLMVALSLSAPVFASEGGEGGKAVDPITLSAQFVRTDRGRMKVWSIQVRIDAPPEILTQITERQPRILDGILVRMTRGPETPAPPTIEEIKRAVTETIEERLGSVIGLDVIVMKLKQTG